MASEIRWPAYRFAAPLVLVLAVSVLVSLLEGVPGSLPGVALGSEVLLHVERVSAMFAIVVAIVSVLREAARGRFPTQVTTAGLAYDADVGPARAAAEQVQRQIEELQAQVRRLRTTALGEDEHKG